MFKFLSRKSEVLLIYYGSFLFIVPSDLEFLQNRNCFVMSCDIAVDVYKQYKNFLYDIYWKNCITNER